VIIKKFQGNSETEAITKARDELGKDAVVMNVKTIKPRGIMKLFKPVVVEVTAALEENIPAPATMQEEKKPEVKEESTTKTMPRPAINPEAFKNDKTPGGKALEENIEKLQELLQKQMGTDGGSSKSLREDDALDTKPRKERSSHLQFVKMIYTTLVDNEVDEKYVNQVMNEMDNVMRSDMQIDTVLSNLYQKLILKFGKPNQIELEEGKTKVVFFVGPTGVGKTTTIAKLASYFKIEKKKSVAFFTTDTYRIAATDQLKTYADIIDAPLSVIYAAEDMESELSKLVDYDLVLVDTAGYSHKNMDQQMEIKKIIDSVPEEYDKQVYLVLSATTKYADLCSIVDAYKSVAEYSLLFTKLDETSGFGNMLNVRMYCGAPLSYTTNGQNVPDDLEVFNSQRIVKLLLGGNA